MEAETILVRGRYVVSDPSKEDGLIRDGAVYLENGQIVAVGPYSQLRERYVGEQEIGSSEHIVLPGLINAHDHGRGVSTLQMGVPDSFVEWWLIALLGLREVDPYLTALLSAAQLAESGVTTSVISYYDPNPEGAEARLESTVRGYRDCGLRVVLALGIQDRSPFATICESLLPSLPLELRDRVTATLRKRRYLSKDDYFVLFRELRRRYMREEDGLVEVALGPVSVHWCSDQLLADVAAEALASGAAVHTHMLETAYQRDESRRRYGKSAVERMAEIGFLSRHLSCAHCIWVSERDVELLAENGTTVVHNPGSNLRLRSGVAPVNTLLAQGVNVAIGLDSNGLNDDGDLLQEMRLAACLHRTPGAGTPSPTALQLLAMATRNGARAAGLEGKLGVLAAGARADLTLLRLEGILSPLTEPHAGIVGSLVQRAKSRDVDSVIVDGRLVVRNGQLCQMDKQEALNELRSRLSDPEGWVGGEMTRLVADLQPYVEDRFGAEESRCIR